MSFSQNSRPRLPESPQTFQRKLPDDYVILITAVQDATAWMHAQQAWLCCFSANGDFAPGNHKQLLLAGCCLEAGVGVGEALLFLQGIHRGNQV